MTQLCASCSSTVENSTLLVQGDVTAGADILQIALNAQAEGTDPEWMNTLQDAIAAEQIDKFSLQANISNPENLWTVSDIDASVTANNSVLSVQGMVTHHSETGPDVNVTVSALGYFCALCISCVSSNEMKMDY